MIKKFLLFLMLTLSSFHQKTLAHTEAQWVHLWIDGCTYFSNKDYPNAISCYSDAITLISSHKNSNNLHLYIERGKIYDIVGEHALAIQDYTTVIDNPHSTTSDLVKAMWCRYYGYAQLKDFQQCQWHYETLQKMDPDFPIIDFIGDILTIKTVQTWDKESLAKLAQIMAALGIIAEEKDVQCSPTGVCFIKLTSDFLKGRPCCKDCEEKKPCKGNSTLYFETQDHHRCLEISKAKKISPDQCKEHCSSAAYYAALACGPLARNCRIVCLSAIEPLRRSCNWCCEGGNFYTKCIRPLKKFFPPPCDPAWD